MMTVHTFEPNARALYIAALELAHSAARLSTDTSALAVTEGREEVFGKIEATRVATAAWLESVGLLAMHDRNAARIPLHTLGQASPEYLDKFARVPDPVRTMQNIVALDVETLRKVAASVGLLIVDQYFADTDELIEHVLNEAIRLDRLNMLADAVDKARADICMIPIPDELLTEPGVLHFFPNRP